MTRLRLRLRAVPVLLALAGASAACAEAAGNAAPPAVVRVIRVGPAQAVATVAEAARIAVDGDVVEIEAGDYIGDVASWRQHHLTLRAVGGRARMIANGASAEGKAIWVIKGDEVLVENVEFSGADVPERNGAGIRHEGGKLTIRNCRFVGNQMGVLTWNDPRGELVVEQSEFRNNAASTSRTGPAIPSATSSTWGRSAASRCATATCITARTGTWSSRGRGRITS